MIILDCNQPTFIVEGDLPTHQRNENGQRAAPAQWRWWERIMLGLIISPSEVFWSRNHLSTLGGRVALSWAPTTESHWESGCHQFNVGELSYLVSSMIMMIMMVKMIIVKREVFKMSNSLFDFSLHCYVGGTVVHLDRLPAWWWWCSLLYWSPWFIFFVMMMMRMWAAPWFILMRILIKILITIFFETFTKIGRQT